MIDQRARPEITQRGIKFTITVGAKRRHCLITEEVLHELSAMRNIDTSGATPMEIFHAFEGTVIGAAKKLDSEKRSEALLVLTAPSFFVPCSGFQ